MEVTRSQYRIPKEISDWLKKRAQRNKRSMNGEMVSILEKMKLAEEMSQ